MTRRADLKELFLYITDMKNVSEKKTFKVITTVASEPDMFYRYLNFIRLILVVVNIFRLKESFRHVKDSFDQKKLYLQEEISSNLYL